MLMIIGGGRGDVLERISGLRSERRSSGSSRSYVVWEHLDVALEEVGWWPTY
jgi:hypothetical protein